MITDIVFSEVAVETIQLNYNIVRNSFNSLRLIDSWEL